MVDRSHLLVPAHVVAIYAHSLPHTLENSVPRQPPRDLQQPRAERLPRALARTLWSGGGQGCPLVGPTPEGQEGRRAAAGIPEVKAGRRGPGAENSALRPPGIQ